MELTAKQRVEEELKELKVKFKKLGDFLDSEKFDNIKGVNRALLHMQYYTMANYIAILRTRLEHWVD